MRRRSTPILRQVAQHVWCFTDACNVYVLVSGRDAVLIDFGTGAVLDHLDELGVERVTDVLLTHHHRDQAQGLDRAVAAGAAVWVPPVEQELIADADGHWLRRQLDNDWDVRQDRFSPLRSVSVAGPVAEYRVRRYGSVELYTLPTPGHTVGSVSYLVDVDGRRIAFIGDLAYDGGKVWSVAATQWTITGVEGQAATYLSCGAILEHRPDLALPAHGPPIADPVAALGRTRRRVRELAELRLGEPWGVSAWREPWVAITPHLLLNRTSFATSYALLSHSGAALLIDWGYDHWTGLLHPTVRPARRPLLTSLAALRSRFGVERVEVVVPTHYHDDHVAGINLLRDVEGTRVWAPENVAPILEQPLRHDLPAVWFDRIPVDRTLPLGRSVAWREYELTVHALPGHTLYAAAIEFTADGQRVLATGDQHGPSAPADGRTLLQYHYRSRFRLDDFVGSANLYRALRPDLVIGGHAEPARMTDRLLDQLLEDGHRVAKLHRELLPLDDVDFGAEGFGARIEPYRSFVAPSQEFDLIVAARNPFPYAAEVVVGLVVPDGWSAEPDRRTQELSGHDDAALRFRVRSGPSAGVHRARLAAELTVDGVLFGQQAEALVDVG